MDAAERAAGLANGLARSLYLEGLDHEPENCRVKAASGDFLAALGKSRRNFVGASVNKGFPKCYILLNTVFYGKPHSGTSIFDLTCGQCWPYGISDAKIWLVTATCASNLPQKRASTVPGNQSSKPNLPDPLCHRTSKAFSGGMTAEICFGSLPIVPESIPKVPKYKFPQLGLATYLEAVR